MHFRANSSAVPGPRLVMILPSTTTRSSENNNNAIFGKFTAYKIRFAARITCGLSIHKNSSLAKDCRSCTNGKHPLIVIIQATNSIFNGSACLEVLYPNTATRQENCIEIGRFQFAQRHIGLNFKPTKAFNYVGSRNRSYRYLESGTAPQIYRNHEFNFFKSICQQDENLHNTSIYVLSYYSFFQSI